MPLPFLVTSIELLEEGEESFFNGQLGWFDTGLHSWNDSLDSSLNTRRGSMAVLDLLLELGPLKLLGLAVAGIVSCAPSTRPA